MSKDKGLIPLKIEEFNFRENTFTSKGREYRVPDLIEAAKDLPEFDLPLCGIDLGVQPWGDLTIKSFVYHMSRVNNASLDYAIILNDEGYPCDGWHRISKAIIEGRSTIRAKRIVIMPEPIKIE